MYTRSSSAKGWRVEVGMYSILQAFTSKQSAYVIDTSPLSDYFTENCVCGTNMRIRIDRLCAQLMQGKSFSLSLSLWNYIYPISNIHFASIFSTIFVHAFSKNWKIKLVFFKLVFKFGNNNADIALKYIRNFTSHQ